MMSTWPLSVSIQTSKPEYYHPPKILKINIVNLYWPAVKILYFNIKLTFLNKVTLDYGLNIIEMKYPNASIHSCL